MVLGFSLELIKKTALNYLCFIFQVGLANPVSRGGRKSKKKRGDEKSAVPSPEPPVEWIKEEKFDPDVHLDGNYKKHIGKHANK